MANMGKMVIAIRTTGPVTREPFWRVTIESGGKAGTQFGRDFQDTLRRAALTVGLERECCRGAIVEASQQ